MGVYFSVGVYENIYWLCMSTLIFELTVCNILALKLLLLLSFVLCIRLGIYYKTEHRSAVRTMDKTDVHILG